MRHAKSDWSADYAIDHDRPLNQRGLRTAELMGRVLTEQGLAPQLVITSSALRARTTAEIAARSGGWRADVVTEPRLYATGPDEVLEVAAGAPPIDLLLMVGHQPTWSMVVAGLTGEQVEMRTGTVAVVDLDIDDWSRLHTAKGELRSVVRPGDHADDR